MAMSKSQTGRAVFIDKDGTLLENVPYNVQPAKVQLRPGAGPALARLREAGFDLVLVTNQPGVAMGLFAPAALDAVWHRIDELLAPHGAALDGVYFCPHHPQGKNLRYAVRCHCRKPQPGMLQQAAWEKGYQLDACWMIGDILDDVEAGRRAGCRTVLLVPGGETEWHDSPFRRPHYRTESLEKAAALILQNAGSQPLPLIQQSWSGDQPWMPW
jgi:histidinol-phosphate phosphatase family protein